MLKNIKNYFKSNLIFYLTLLVGTIIIGIIYFLQNVAPFGKNSLLTIDFFHQYGPLLNELYERVKSGSNFIYSFSMGMGLPFFRNFLNYLSSPFNIIMFLFNHDNLIMSFSIIIGAKAVASSLTMVYFISKKFKSKNLYFIPLAILYGFCSYFAAYYWNIMWLDGLVFLPLIILGIERIVDGNRYALYIISLAIMLVANYFIGFMICFFSVLYFIAYLIIQTKKFDYKFILKKIFSFGISSLLAGGLTAAFLVPLYLGMHSISATSDSWPTSQYYAFTFWEFLGNHFSGVGVTVLSSGISNAANISTGILSVALFFLFIINPKINLKIKISYISLLAFIVLSFFYAPLDFIWHAFHVPNDLPYRYSFIYSFVFLIIATYSLINIKHIKFKYASMVYVLIMMLITLTYFLKYKNLTNSMITLNYLLITLYFVIYCLYLYYPQIKKFLPYALILSIILECTISINNNWKISQYLDDFYSDYNTMQKALKYIRKEDQSLMYRIDRTEFLTLNDPSWYNYYGQTTFSSMAYEKMAILQHNLGIPGNEINSYFYKQNTPIYDLMFNIKYFFGSTWDIKRYNLFYNKEGHLVFKNNYNAGLMFAVNSNIKDWSSNGFNPFTIQNEFIEKATGINKVLEKLDIANKETVYNNNQSVIKYTFTNPHDNMYFYINDSDIDFIIVNQTLYYLTDNYTYFEKSNDKIDVFDVKNMAENQIINTRTDNDTYTIYVGYNNYRYDSFNGYYINNDNFEKAASIAKDNQVKITEFKEHYIKGNIDLPTNKTIYTSIPYDEGWKVYVDNKEVPTFSIGKALLAFDVNSGNHNIELKYIAKGSLTGIVISGFSLLTITSIFLYTKRKNLK